MTQTAVTQTAEWLIAADDRTGALEVAGACARDGSPVAVVAGSTGHVRVPGVVDLGTRHVAPSIAAHRAVAIDCAGIAPIHAHKIDSTLRGNWAVELAARHAANGRPVLLVPALPALGRTCRDGTVLEHGRPVAHGGDARRAAIDSRPAALLTAAGAPVVIELADADAVQDWLRSPDGIAVADAATDSDLASIGAAWVGAGATTLLAGTSAGVAAGIAALEPGRGVAPAPQIGPGRVVVVCGSLHPAARRQLAALDATVANRGAGRSIDVVTSAPPERVPVAAHAAEATAAHLAAQAGELIARGDVVAVIVLGGDTAAALMGDATWFVGGTVAAGTPWSRQADDATVYVTRAGGFGDDDALIDVIDALAPIPAGHRP